MPTQHVCFACLAVCNCGSHFAWQCQLCATCKAESDALFEKAGVTGPLEASTPAELPEPDEPIWPDLTDTPAFADPVDEWLHRR